MAYMDSSRRDLYFEGGQTRVVGGLAELGSGGRKEDLVYAATPPPHPFAALFLIEFVK